jgi:hypothetical protein
MNAKSSQGTAPDRTELEDLILLALAKRKQMNADEMLQPLPARRDSFAFTGNVSKIAHFEGWSHDANEIDAAVRRLAKAGMIVTDGMSAEPNLTGHLARLHPNGYARAASISRKYLGHPLAHFSRDKTFDENGTGQVEVDFLGERIVIGCVEGEEDRAIQHAHRFEVDTGEVLKAVSGLDNVRAMLMAGVLAHEHIEELESEIHATAPASDRIVGLDHNSAAYQATVRAVDRLIVIVGTSNVYREREPDDHERRLAELEAGRRLLGSRWLSLHTLKAALLGTITYLAGKFADAPIGEAATAAWSAIKILLGLH